MTKLTETDLTDFAIHVERELEREDGEVFWPVNYAIERSSMMQPTEDGVRTITVRMPASIGKTRLL